MQILIENIRQEHIETTTYSDAEKVYIAGKVHVHFKVISGQIELNGCYTINENIDNMTINQIKEGVEKYYKERLLK